MVFSSIPFLFFFLPICLILYYIVPYSFKNTILLIFSLIFYAWGEPVYILLLLFATLVDYTNGRLMTKFGTTTARRRIFLLFSIGINLSVLAFFKYADFLIGTVNAVFNTEIRPLGLSLPIGISFFTFQTMSYVIDLYRGQVPQEKSYKDYLTYVSMFPQLVAGPIVRYSDVREELRGRKIKKEDVQEGFLRFLRGLFKKILLANQIGGLWEEIHMLGAGNASAATAWLGALAFTLQLYFDFSAYSDMAIGMGRMLGFHFPENFVYPLSSVSITDFWRRWHISLGTWFRDYVYIPLGGSRCSRFRTCVNKMIVFILTGIWHGSSMTFLLWGFLHGVAVTTEVVVKKRLPKVLSHIVTLIFVAVTFSIFRADSLGQAGAILKGMVTFTGLSTNAAVVMWGQFTLYFVVVIILALLYCIPMQKVIYKSRIGVKYQKVITLVPYLISVLLLYLCITKIAAADYSPFIYFKF